MINTANYDINNGISKEEVSKLSQNTKAKITIMEKYAIKAMEKTIELWEDQKASFINEGKKAITIDKQRYQEADTTLKRFKAIANEVDELINNKYMLVGVLALYTPTLLSLGIFSKTALAVKPALAKAANVMAIKAGFVSSASSAQKAAIEITVLSGEHKKLTKKEKKAKFGEIAKDMGNIILGLCDVGGLANAQVKKYIMQATGYSMDLIGGHVHKKYSQEDLQEEINNNVDEKNKSEELKNTLLEIKNNNKNASEEELAVLVYEEILKDGKIEPMEREVVKEVGLYDLLNKQSKRARQIILSKKEKNKSNNIEIK